MEKWEVLKLLQEGKTIQCKQPYNGKLVNLKLDKTGSLLVDYNGEWNFSRYLFDYFMEHVDFKECSETYKSGDWVLTRAGQILHIDELNTFYYFDYFLVDEDENVDCHKISEIYRKATVKEISQEIVKREWLKWGRRPYEWAEGDIVVDDLDHNALGAITKIDGDIVYTTYSDHGVHYKEITMVCPWSYREDISEEIKLKLR